MPLHNRIVPVLAEKITLIARSAELLIKKFLLLLIFGWQKTLGPLLGPRCRFYPSCSQYAKDALKLYPLPNAFIKSTKRILKCHPFHPGGIDLP